MRTHDGGEQPRPRADLPFNPPRLELQPLPDTVTTVELTTRPARGKSHKTERYQEYARAKVQRLCFAPPNPEIHIIHPPHMLQPVGGEEDTLPGTREATREATDAGADADNASVQFALDDGMDVDEDSGAEDSEAVTEDVVFEEIVVAVEDAAIPAEREGSSTPRATQSRKRKRESNGPPTRQMARRTGARAGVPPGAGQSTSATTSATTSTTRQNGQATRHTARRTGAAPLPAMPLSATPRTRSGRGMEASSPANGPVRTRSGVKAGAENGKGKGKGRAQPVQTVGTPSRTTRSGRALGVKAEPGERQFFSHVEVPKIDTSGYRWLEIP